MSIKCYSILSGTQGENIFEHIICENNEFSVNETPFSLSELKGVVKQEVVVGKGKRQSLVSFTSAGRNFPTHVQLENDQKKPITALLFLRGPKDKNLGPHNKGKTQTNLRCPMPAAYWSSIIDIESLKDRELIKSEKAALRSEFPKQVVLEDNGVTLILPTLGKHLNRPSYLVAMTDGSSFEWVLARVSRNIPNCYRVECNNGVVSLVDPRREARKQR